MKDYFERRRHVQNRFKGRIGAAQWDDGYTNYANLLKDGYAVRVFCNGRERSNWKWADSDAGKLECMDGVTYAGSVEIRVSREEGTTA